MAIIKKIKDKKNREQKNNSSLLSDIYDNVTIMNNKIFQLLKYENEFIKYLKEIITTIKNKDEDDILKSLIIISDTAKEKIGLLTKNIETGREKIIFRKFAVSRLARELSLLEKYCSKKIDEKKRESVDEYCKYLLENSALNYTDFNILNENINYYTSYNSLISSGKNLDHIKNSKHDIYNAAINGAIKNLDIAAAKMFLNIKEIAKVFDDEEILYLQKLIDNLEINLYMTELIEQFMPKNDEELKSNIQKINEFIRSNAIEKNIGEKLIIKIEEYFYYQSLIENLKIQRITTEILYQTLLKIYNTDIALTEILSLDLPENLITFLRNIIKNSLSKLNEKKLKRINNIYKTVRTKIIDEEIVSIFSITQDTSINENLRLQDIIKLIKTFAVTEQKRLNIEEEKNGNI